VFDAIGNAYVGGPQGVLVKLDPLGNVVTTFNVPLTGGAVGPDWIDLARDQRTIFYTYERQVVKRYDVVSNTPLPDFADLSSVMNPGQRLFALRLLPDDGLLIAGQRELYRLDAQGKVVQTYDVPGEDQFFSLALTPDCQSFWTGTLFNSTFSAFNVYEFGIASGLVERSFDAKSSVGGVAVLGDACGGSLSRVPAPTTLWLVGAGLTIVAILQARNKRPSKPAHLNS